MCHPKILGLAPSLAVTLAIGFHFDIIKGNIFDKK